MAYKVFLGGVMLPVPPEKLTTKIVNKNKTTVLVNDGEINLLKRPGLSEISFDALLPNQKYDFAMYASGFVPSGYYLDALEIIKTSLRPVWFKVLRPALVETNVAVTLEDYSITEDAANHPDITISVNLKLWRNYGAKKLNLTSIASEGVSADAVVASAESPRSGEPPKTSEYTVAEGDNLWLIAQKLLGDGALWRKIWLLNKDAITNPNIITPGEVLRIQ